MNLLFSLVIFAALLSLCLAQEVTEAHFHDCAEKLIKDDKDLKCAISKLKVNGTMPKVKEFMNCAFSASGWTDSDGKNLNVDKLTEDLRRRGNKVVVDDALFKQVVKECESTKAEMSAIDYVTCLMNDKRTSRSFITTLRLREVIFYMQDHCPPKVFPSRRPSRQAN